MPPSAGTALSRAPAAPDRARLPGRGCPGRREAPGGQRPPVRPGCSPGRSRRDGARWSWQDLAGTRRAARSGSGGGIPATPMEERTRNGRERGGDSGGGAALWRAPGRGWCEEPHFNEGRANANHCNRQQQKKGEAAAARAPQQRATARGGVTKAAEPLSAATTAPTAGWSRGEGGSCRSLAASHSEPPPSLRARPAGLSEEVPARLRRTGKRWGWGCACPALPRAGAAACGAAGARSRRGAERCTCAHCVGRRPPPGAAGGSVGTERVPGSGSWSGPGERVSGCGSGSGPGERARRCPGCPVARASRWGLRCPVPAPEEWACVTHGSPTPAE